MMIPRRLALLLAFLPCAAAGDDAGCRLGIRIVDGGGEPVSGAVVTLVPGEVSESTGSNGAACFEQLESGTYQIVVAAEGFSVGVEAVDVEAVGRMDRRLSLLPAFGQEIVVSGTRTERRLADVPVHIQKIEREQILAAGARTLAEAVEYTSGVRVENNCQNCNTSQVRMLGLEGAYSQLLVDSQPMVSSLAMVYGIEQFPARLLDGVEVMKGGGSAVYGAGAVGGTINLIPHRADHTHIEIEARATEMAGQRGQALGAIVDWASQARTSGLTVFGQYDQVPAVDLDGDRYSEVTDRDLFVGGLRFEQFLLEGRGRLAAEANSTDASRRGGDLERFDRPPHETSLTEAIDTERLAASLQWLHSPGPGFDYRFAASWASTDRRSYYGSLFDPLAYGTSANPVAVVDLQMNHHLSRNTLTWGVQAGREEILDVQPGYARRVEETYDSLGVFLQDDRKVGNRLTLLYGGRVDSHSAVENPIFSPRLALLWSPRATLTIRSSVARGFRPPAVFDEDLHIRLVGGGAAQVVRNAHGLREESSTAYLLSTEWRPLFLRKGSAAIELNLFRTDLDDLFDDQQGDDPATPEIEYWKVNFGRARIQGVEFATAFRWGSRVSGEVGVVRQTAEYDRPEPEFGSTAFLRTPELYGTASVRWQLDREIALFFGALYTGSMLAPHYAGFIEEDRLEITPTFLTFDFNVAKTFSLGGEKAFTATAGVRNITDDYQEDLDRGPLRDPSYVYGPRFPRSVFLTFRVDV